MNEVQTCTWREDEDGVWQACDTNAWVFDDGGVPHEHGMKFCPFCGNHLGQMPYFEACEACGIRPWTRWDAAGEAQLCDQCLKQLGEAG